MSDTSNDYTCGVCTYVQSSNVAKCEMCDTPNPSRPKSQPPPSREPTAPCPKCSYVNTGDHIKICEACEYEFTPNKDVTKKFRADEEEEEEEDEEEEDYDDANDYNDFDNEDYERPMLKTKDQKRKAVEAVEKPMNDKEFKAFFDEYITVLKEQRLQTTTIPEKNLHKIIEQLFRSLQYKNDQSEGELVFRCCQICLDKDEPVITMNACGHRMICPDDFHQYLSIRIRDGEILPWIPCPAEICGVPCDAKNITEDGRLTRSELLSFIVTYMLKKLSRNENFITCIQCEQGGFLQFGTPKKQDVVCPVCNFKQTIEKGADGDLDIAFKQMIQSGQLRECPTCRHLTLKEKGLCNVLECAKCGIWWNWRTREQGHNGKDMKNRARNNGTLWEPGELRFQQDLERNNPKEFQALLERNGIQYNPNYVRGGWNDN